MSQIRPRTRYLTVVYMVIAAATLLGCQPDLPGPAGPAPGYEPLPDIPLFVEADTRAHRQMAAWRHSRPADAAYMARIAKRGPGRMTARPPHRSGPRPRQRLCRYDHRLGVR
jgi:hypothetical protein